MGLSGLEPPTSRLSGVRSNRLSYKPIFFFCFGGHLLSHTVSSAVPSAAQVLTIVFGMGTGVSHKRIATKKAWALSEVFSSLELGLFSALGETFDTWWGSFEPSIIVHRVRSFEPSKENPHPFDAPFSALPSPWTLNNRQLLLHRFAMRCAFSLTSPSGSLSVLCILLLP